MVGEIDRLEMENCVYSQATLSGLSLVLPPETYADWITKMTRAGLDYKNPVYKPCTTIPVFYSTRCEDWTAMEDTSQ